MRIVDNKDNNLKSQDKSEYDSFKTISIHKDYNT